MSFFQGPPEAKPGPIQKPPAQESPLAFAKEVNHLPGSAPFHHTLNPPAQTRRLARTYLAWPPQWSLSALPGAPVSLFQGEEGEEEGESEGQQQGAKGEVHLQEEERTGPGADGAEG